MNDETKKKVMGKINEIKSNIETFISDVNVNDIKANFNNIVKEAQADFHKLIDKDLDVVRAKLQKEKDDIEVKAKKFLESHREELTSLQNRFDKLMKATANLRTGKKTVATKKAAPMRKKTVKKMIKAKTSKVKSKK